MKKVTLLEKARKHYTAAEVEQLAAACAFASKYHKGQKRVSGEPYIRHPYNVASLLLDWQVDINTVIAGVLHDTIEDTDATLQNIESQFGHDVAFLVDGVTKVSEARRGMNDINEYLPKTKDNLSKLFIAISQDLRVLLIKLADRLHNLQTLEYLPEERQRKIASESLEVFAPLADRLGMGKVRVQIEELAFFYLEPKRYQYLQKLLKKRLGRSHKNLEIVRRAVARQLQEAGIEAIMDGRVKSIYSLHKKLKKVDGDIDQVYDFMALRVIVDSKEDCYKVLGVIHAMYQPMLTKIKDYIAVPKANGYQSLHTTVITPTEQIVEFQIRSRAMHEHADRGLAASFHYNEQKTTKNYIKGISKDLPRDLEWIARVQTITQKIVTGEEVPEGELSVDLFADRIFVYTPRGDILDLPEGSYPLDFAFAVHSDIAVHAHTIRINNKIAPFSKHLQNGDIVQVETRSNVRPRADWLDHVQTAKAKQKIKAWLKANTS